MSLKKEKNEEKDTIAVFIDGDNISHKYIPIILREIKIYGKIIINNVYCDWSQTEFLKLKQVAIENGITTIQCERVSGKNSTDIKLIVDIMRTLYEYSHISLYYIITSDSDYRHVIPQIRLKNKKIHCIGSSSSNMSIVSMCDLFTKIEDLTNLNNRQKKKIKVISNDSTLSPNRANFLSMNTVNDIDAIQSQKHILIQDENKNTKHKSLNNEVILLKKNTHSNVINEKKKKKKERVFKITN